MATLKTWPGGAAALPTNMADLFHKNTNLLAHLNFNVDPNHSFPDSFRMLRTCRFCAPCPWCIPAYLSSAKLSNLRGLGLAEHKRLDSCRELDMFLHVSACFCLLHAFWRPFSASKSIISKGWHLFKSIRVLEPLEAIRFQDFHASARLGRAYSAYALLARP